MKLDQNLVNAVIAFIDDRFPNQEGEAAAMYTEDGEILISTSPEVFNESTTLCHEVGALCEAYAKKKRITATVCVSKSADGEIRFFAPCGICRERLMMYGGKVECAVAKIDEPTAWEMQTLDQLLPHYWRDAIK